MTKYEKEVIKENLQHFIKNFGNIRIESDGDKGFNVYLPSNSDWPIHYCHNIHYLDGWLYGCVQSANRREFRENGEWFGHIRWRPSGAACRHAMPICAEMCSRNPALD